MTAPRTRIASWMDLANPTRFVGFANKAVPWLAGAAYLVLAISLYMSFAAPELPAGHDGAHRIHGFAWLSHDVLR